MEQYDRRRVDTYVKLNGNRKSQMTSVMEGKNILITGARNKWSIAWHTAQSVLRQGGRVAFSVYGEREAGSVNKLLVDAGVEAPILMCNVNEDAQIEALFRQVADVFDGKLDGILHSIAFANREDLGGEYVTTSRKGFLEAHDASVYSLVALSAAGRELMQAAGGGSIVTLTYIGGERVVPNYNVMGVAKAALEASVKYLASDMGKDHIRVNAISAGPIKTLAAGGISGFDAMVKLVAERSPLKRGVDADEVGDAVMFLLSPWARGITGEVIHVDAGYHIVGMV